MKLFVQVLDASDLMPKDGHGSSSPFVEVEFDRQVQRTQTMPNDLNPFWNQTLVFSVSDPAGLPNQTIDVVVYNDPSAGHHRSFLGRVCISGVSVPLSQSDAAAQRYPLEKRGLFSHIRGDISLRLFAVDDSTAQAAPEAEKKKKKKTTQSWYSLGKGDEFHFNPTEERAEFFRKENGEVVTVQHMQAVQFPVDCRKVEPAVEGAVGEKGRRRRGLVEEMEYLFVKVEKACDLPAKDILGSLDPYVEVKVGNYKGSTGFVERNQSPVWNQVFAFPKERLQANLLEVVLKDKDLLKDDFVGRVVVDLEEVLRRAPPDGPLAPAWHRMEDKDGGRVDKGEVMLAVWMGTQADQCFPEALHADAHSLQPESIAFTRSGIYHSPKLFYLCLHVIEAQDLVPADKSRPPDATVKVELSPNQVRHTRPAAFRSHNPVWNEELVFVAAEPLSERWLTLTVEDRVGPTKREPLGRVGVPLAAVAALRSESDHYKPIDPQWFNLSAPAEAKFASKIRVRMCLEGGYHVLDEPTHYSSDLQPSVTYPWARPIGVLEVGIISASNILPMKTGSGRAADPYCVAKYGSKWVRTRTQLNTLAPRWNEQYTWDVHDPCTVITLAVFDNWQILGEKGRRDGLIGRVRLRLSTLETDRVYMQSYPLLLLQPSGLKIAGELRLAVRFACTAWLNMMSLYVRPLLPRMHYLDPIAVVHVDALRRQAVQIVAAHLGRAEPPLLREVVECVLDADHHMWSLRRSRANFDRIGALFSAAVRAARLVDDVRDWRNPVTTCLVHVLFFLLVCYPELILPTAFLYLFAIGVSNYRRRPRRPPRVDEKLSHAAAAHFDDLDEEFDSFPTSRHNDLVRVRYERLRNVAERVQTVVGDMATQAERVQAVLSWRDPRATAIFIVFAVAVAFLLYVVPFQVVVLVGGVYLLRHPRWRSRKMPSAAVNFFKRLPAKSELLL